MKFYNLLKKPYRFKSQSFSEVSSDTKKVYSLKKKFNSNLLLSLSHTYSPCMFDLPGVVLHSALHISACHANAANSDAVALEELNKFEIF